MPQHDAPFLTTRPLGQAGSFAAPRPRSADGGRRATLLAAAAGEPPFADRHRLTPRERDVLRLLLADHTCRQVASALGLSQRTVEHYLDRLKLRFGKATLHGLATILVAEHLLE